jgi:hypothetical protein
MKRSQNGAKHLSRSNLIFRIGFPIARTPTHSLFRDVRSRIRDGSWERRIRQGANSGSHCQGQGPRLEVAAPEHMLASTEAREKTVPCRNPSQG